MRAIDIKVGELETFQVKDMRIKHYPNEHATLEIEGYINAAEIESVKRFTLADELLQISASDDGATWYWHGYIFDMEIQHLLHETYVKLTLISQSVKMDQTKKTRSFQKEGTKISEIIDYICKEYKALVTVNGVDKEIDGMLVQYQETDWEFLKRLASHLNEQVIVYSKHAGLVIDIGLSSVSDIAGTAPSVITYRNDIQALRRELDYDLTEADVEIAIFDSREMLGITDVIETGKGNFYIYGIESKFQQEELVMKYTGYRRKNYKTPLVRNRNIIGASLNGKVHAVSGSKVQVDLDVDVNNTLCGNKDFSYATVYSSDAGTGWYCMPEVGDTVRVYFPSDIEKNAYAISSVHLDVEIDDSRSNPEIKSISNAQKKQIVFSPEGILLQNTENMYVSLNDTTGIEIVSNLPITIHSDMNITMDAATNIEINGMTQVALKQGTCGTTINQEGGQAQASTTAVATTDQTATEPASTSDATILLSDGTITVSGVEFRLQENEGV